MGEELTTLFAFTFVAFSYDIHDLQRVPLFIPSSINKENILISLALCSVQDHQ
jgi:hypothetical protein